MSDWRDLEDELGLWAEMGTSATFWWRDDDAVEDTSELRRLLELRGRHDVPLAIAAIPARADETLARALAAASKTAILQHGYAHRSHTLNARAKSELGPERPLAAVLHDLSVGRERMGALFGADWSPILVPPWNRIGATVEAALPENGYRGLSSMGARGAGEAVPGFRRIDVHMDLIDWPGTREFAGDGVVLEAALRHLRLRREGATERDEPTGMMTHHLAHDRGCWGFVESFLAATSGHPAARWVDVSSAFGLGS